MAPKSSYTDLVHGIVRDAEDSLSLDDITQQLVELSVDSPPKNARNTVRSAIRASHLIKSAGKSRFAWLPKQIQGARVRHTLTAAEFTERAIFWDTDAAMALWPAADEAEKRRERPSLLAQTEAGVELSLELDQESERKESHPETAFWAWISQERGEPGDDLILTITNSQDHHIHLRLEPRSERSVALIEERNRQVRRRIDVFLATQRDGLASPGEIAADLLASQSYHDSVPPQSLSNLLPAEVIDRYGRTVDADGLKVNKQSNVIPFPTKVVSESAELPPRSQESAEARNSIELVIPYHTGQELPDEKAYREAMAVLEDAPRTSSALAIHALGLSKLCSSAYAVLSQTAEFRKEALELAGQAVIAAERRIAHGFIESLISGEELAVEEAFATYLEARSFLARALWHGGSFDEAIEQAMHCFEIDPEEPTVREDLFVMLFDSDRHDMVLSLLDSFEGASETENLYHRALAALLDDPQSKEAIKLLRKATTHNPYLASLFLGEEPKKARKSQVDEGTAYERAYGFLWRREDSIFDLLEEIVLSKR